MNDKVDDTSNSKGISRRTILKMAATTGAAAMVSPRIVMATGEQPVKFGVDNPVTGTYAITGRNELQGMQLAIEEINAMGGILGRQATLVVEDRSEEHTSELQSLMRISYAVFCLKKK